MVDRVEAASLNRQQPAAGPTGSVLNARDVKAVRKTISGLIKLIYPDGEVSKVEMSELLELALEGRRRVKEQLKKMGSFELRRPPRIVGLLSSGVKKNTPQSHS